MKKNLTILFMVIISITLGCTTDSTKPKSETKADFAFKVVTLAPNGLVEFIDKSTNAKNLSWDFGDGETETGTDPIHNYAKAGTYKVTLTATNGSKTSSISKDVVMKGGDYQQVFVKGVTIKKIPSTDSNGDPWDPSNGPDLYVILEPYGQNYVLSTILNVFEDVTSYPIKWNLSPSVNIQDLFEDYTLYVIDQDYPNAPQVISQCQFDFDSFTDYPTNAEFTCGGTTVEFELAWY